MCQVKCKSPRVCLAAFWYFKHVNEISSWLIIGYCWHNICLWWNELCHTTQQHSGILYKQSLFCFCNYRKAWEALDWIACIVLYIIKMMARFMNLKPKWKENYAYFLALCGLELRCKMQAVVKLALIYSFQNAHFGFKNLLLAAQLKQTYKSNKISNAKRAIMKHNILFSSHITHTNCWQKR